MVVFAAENVHNFTALYENNGGVKAIRSYENKTWHKDYFILMI